MNEAPYLRETKSYLNVIKAACNISAELAATSVGVEINKSELYNLLRKRAVQDYIRFSFYFRHKIKSGKDLSMKIRKRTRKCS